MSDPRTKAERSQAKDVRQGITEQRPGQTKNKRARPFAIMHNSRLKGMPRVWGRYRTQEEAEHALAQLRRKYLRLENSWIERVESK